ncbi:phage holin [Acetobacterium wieringae]|uniref:phage holin n=1 Tax=Acetobacterium wieringae TaxID=52694 RepID=UPI00203411E3|nr:phage holin [Acetobacterium wieringae]URN85139.1 phage holin [Acetobacterium wieringae]
MNLKDVKTDVWIRLVVLVLALVNGILTASGMNPIAVSETELYVLLSNAAMIGASLWTAWKNNSITASAQQSDIIMKNLKQAALKIIMDKSSQMLAEQEEAVNAAAEKAVQ